MKIKIFCIIILILAHTSWAQVKFSGNADYTQQEDRNLFVNNKLEHILKIYEHPKFLVSISNALSVDLDCFKNEIKETNVFTTLKIDF